MQLIFDAVQEACPRAVWSRGVTLARGDAVSIEERRNGSITLRVETKKGLSAPQVTLHPTDEDWECSCNTPDDPCDHVAASVIALRRSQKAGEELPTQGEGKGRIVYELEDRAGQLHMTRTIEFEGKRTPLLGSLTAAVAGHRVGPDFVATPSDVAIERVLANRPAGSASRPNVANLLDKLAGSERVFLDGQPIKVDSEPLGLTGRVVDAPGGVRLFVEQDKRIERAFRNGLVLTNDTLHPLAPNKLNGRELADLPRGRFYSDNDLAVLVSCLHWRVVIGALTDEHIKIVKPRRRAF